MGNEIIGRKVPQGLSKSYQHPFTKNQRSFVWIPIKIIKFHGYII